MNNLHFVCYTNEQYIPIANLFTRIFTVKTEYRYPITVITNGGSKQVHVTDKINVIDTNTPFGGSGEHFTFSLLTALKQLSRKYVFFFCDDYFITKSIDHTKLIKLLDLLEKDDIKFFSFSSCHPKAKNWELYSQNILEDELFVIPEDFQYMFSVQPCIWNRETLINVLEANIGITLHNFDNSVLADINGERRTIISGTEKYTSWINPHIYGFKKLCSNYKAYDELEEFNLHKYFIIQYVEAVRHGLFNIYLNVRGAEYLKVLLQNFNINSLDNIYGRFFSR